MNCELSTMSEKELLQLQAAVIAELKARGVVRSKNNPLGDYTEWLVAKALNLTLAGNSAAGYDATDSSGVRYQIKGRRVTRDNPSRQLSAIRNLDAAVFDFLAAVIFDENFSVVDAVILPHAVVGEYGSYRAHVNAHVLHVRGSLMKDSRVIDFRDQVEPILQGHL